MKKAIYIIVFVFVACNNETYVSELPTIYNPEINDTMVQRTYLALGDSYTIGESVTEKERWPVQLVEKLEFKNYVLKEPVLIAQTGWTTGNLNEAIISKNLTETFDIVTLLIGVNNQFQGLSITEFQEQFRELLTKAISFAKNKPENVIVVSIPDWGVSPFANSLERDKISSEIDAFNAVKKEETLKQNAIFVDITPISRLALNNSNLIASDNLHFSGEMYALWVEEIIKIGFSN
jgi:lysophospholipase L1-like esterase